MKRASMRVGDMRHEVNLGDLDVFGSATLSACGRYRYELRRVWHEELRKLAIIGLNPSTADALEDDPTIRRCIGFAKSHGYGGIIMLNLWAFRATDPKRLKAALDREAARAFVDGTSMSAADDTNQERLLGITCMPGVDTVCAWGAHGELDGQADRIVKLLRGANRKLHHLGLTKAGHPRHPLYLPATTRMREWTQPK